MATIYVMEPDEVDGPVWMAQRVAVGDYIYRPSDKQWWVVDDLRAESVFLPPTARRANDLETMVLNANDSMNSPGAIRRKDVDGNDDH